MMHTGVSQTAVPYESSSPARTAFQTIYDKAVNSFAAQHDVGYSTKMRGAEEVVSILCDVAHSGNRLLDSQHAGMTLFESAEKIRREAIGGYKKLLPGKLRISNLEEINDLAVLVPGVRHYQTSHPFRLDNPVTGTVYGTLAGIASSLLPFQEEIMIADEIMRKVSEDALQIGACATMGFIAGGAGMLYFRNRIPKDRADFNNARIWDSTQFLDVIRYFAWQGEDALAHIQGQEYRIPSYSTLPQTRFKQTRKHARDNLRSNPLVKRLGVRIVD